MLNNLVGKKNETRKKRNVTYIAKYALRENRKLTNVISKKEKKLHRRFDWQCFAG